MPIEIRTPALIRPQKKRGTFVPIGLFDVLKFEKTSKRQVSILREKGFRFPTNDQCMAYKIATELHRKAPGKTGVRISIQKNSPPHKGLSSWISASAGTLLALNRLWNLKLSEKKLVEIADKMDPAIGKVLKAHFKSHESRSPGKWAIVVTPKLIEIDRKWIQTTAARLKLLPESIADRHFPDLPMIKRALEKAGWGQVGMSGQGPAIVGFSEKRIGIAKIPKTIRSKLDFVWIGKACNERFKLID
jgi:4-diphosphocytidyl-2-C-methyl-D-erythritol kinase